MTIDSWIAGHARFSADKPALIFNATSITYRELDQRISETAGVLSGRLRLCKGERIAYLGFDHPEILALLFAAARLGIVAVPLNPQLPPPELSAILLHSGTTVLFHDSACSVAAAALQQFQTELATVSFECASGLQALRDELADKLICRRSDALVSMSDPYLLVYTSGTPGQPKGVVLSQQAVLCNMLMSQHMHDMTSHDRILSTLPLSMLSGLNVQVLPALFLGATVNLTASIDSAAILSCLGKAVISLLLTEPVVLQALLSHDAWPACDKSSLRAIAVGSSEAPLEIIEQVHACSIPFIQFYGVAETGGLATYQRIDQALDSAGSIGRCGLHCAVRLLTVEGFDAPVGQLGEICVQGDNILSSYWSGDPVTDDAGAVDKQHGDESNWHGKLHNGWVRTGDVASIDRAGNYWFVGQMKHAIVSGDKTVYPAQIERAVNNIDGVVDVVVVARAQVDWGEVPVAVVECRDDSLTAEIILQTLSKQLEPFKLPREILFVDELPRHSSGRIHYDKVYKLVDPSFADETDLIEYDGVI